MSRLQGGDPRENIVSGFVNSIEWADICLEYGIISGGLASPSFLKEPSTEVLDFTSRLYDACLGREPETGGLNDWASKLANLQVSGTEAAYGFFFSSEFIGFDLTDEEYLNRLYETFLGRPADSIGKADWLGRMELGATREEVFYGLANSNEFMNICASYGIIR